MQETVTPVMWVEQDLIAGETIARAYPSTYLSHAAAVRPLGMPTDDTFDATILSLQSITAGGVPIADDSTVNPEWATVQVSLAREHLLNAANLSLAPDVRVTHFDLAGRRLEGLREWYVAHEEPVPDALEAACNTWLAAGGV